MSNEKDKPIFGNEMKSTASNNESSETEQVFTPDEIAARFGGTDPRLDELNALHKGLPAYSYELIEQHIRIGENAKPRGQMLVELSMDDRLDVCQFRHRKNPPHDETALIFDLYGGPRRENNDQLVSEIIQKYEQFRHERLDAHGIPRDRSQCTAEEIAYIERENKKQRNAWLSGVSYGMLPELTVTQRGELASRFYGLYTVFTSQPNRILEGDGAYRFWEGDVSAAMDNLKVPRSLDECTDEEQTFLAVKFSEREQDAADLTRRAKDAPVDPYPLNKSEYMAASLERWDSDAVLFSKHLGPDISDAKVLRDLDYMDLINKMSRADEFILHSPAKHGQSVSRFAAGKTRSILEGGFRRNELWVDSSFIRPSTERKTLFTEQMWYDTRSRIKGPPLHSDDSLEMFRAKMSNRAHGGRTVGWDIVSQAYPSPALGAFTSIHNPRQTGKRSLMMAWQLAMYGIGNTTWPRTSCGFFLHAAYDLHVERSRMITLPRLSVLSVLFERVYEDLFSHIPKLDYDNPNRTRSTPRYPSRRK